MPPPEERRGRHRVMGRAERPLSDQASLEQARDRMQLGDLEGLVARQGRKDGGQPSREHRLAGARRADHQDVVPSGGRHLEGPTRLRLPSHLGEVHGVPYILHRAYRLGGAGPPRTPEEPDDLGEG